MEAKITVRSLSCRAFRLLCRRDTFSVLKISPSKEFNFICSCVINKMERVKKGFCNGDFWKVDMQLLPIKMHYFLYLGAIGCVLPFRTLFAKQLGISATAVGIIFLVVPFMKFLTNPLFGVIGDYFKRFRLLIATLVALVAASHFAMIYIPPLESSPAAALTSNVHVNVTCHNEALLHAIARLDEKYLTRPVDVTCQVKCSPKENNPGDDPRIEAGVHFIANACMLHFNLYDVNLVRDSTNMTKSFLDLYLTEELPLIPDCSDTTVDTRNGSTSKVDCSDTTVDTRNGSTSKMDCSDTTVDTRNRSTSKVDCSDTTVDTRNRSTSKVVETNRQWAIDGSNGCPANLSCILEKCRDGDDKEVEVKNEFLSFQLWWLFLMIFISSTTHSAVLFLIDTICHEMLENKKTDYGHQRQWGAIGWAAGAFFGGYLNDLVSPDASNIDYSFSFYLLVLLMIVDLIPVSQLKVDEIKYSPNIFKDVCFLLSQPYIAFYMGIVFVNGILSGLVWNYQFWLFEEIGASQVLLGLSQVTESLVELPCFVIAGWVIKKIGYDNCNNLSLLCFGLRYLSLAYMYNPLWILPLGIFSGPSFGIFFAAITMFGKKEAPPGTEATIQSLLSLAFEGVGYGVGTVLGGLGFDGIGSRKTFLCSAIASFAFMVINIAMQILRKKKVQLYGLT